MMTWESDVMERLRSLGQAHIRHHAERLSAAERAALLEQVRGLPLDDLPELVREYVLRKPETELPEDLEPVTYYPHDATDSRRPWDRAAYKREGEGLIRAGKVAAFTVAGGQGSRLGFNGPKGCYPAGAVTGKPLFQFFAEGLAATCRRYGRPVPWYIMTSPQNHQATIAFFRAHEFFGLDERDVMFFQQGEMPSLEMGTGRLMLAERGVIATNPDGHGGSVRALHVSGALADMKRRGVEQVSYFQVDNPLVRVVDPVFLGLHATAPDSSGEMSSKMVAKARPDERVGVFCTSGGKTMVVEYSDLPDALKVETQADGMLRFAAGSIAIHIISVGFLNRLATEAACNLPYHRAEKVVDVYDEGKGDIVRPEGNNAVKLEKFIFDALPLCRSSIVMETDRIEEFAPIKQPEGQDSPASSAAIQTERAARWLETAGERVPRDERGQPDCVIEISPLTAMEARDLACVTLPAAIERGSRVAL